MCKISEVPGQLICIKLFFKNKLSVSILGLYAGVFFMVYLSQADEINSLMSRAMNESFFVIFGSDFNKDGSRKCASFKKCLDLRLVNSLVGSLVMWTPTWSNSCGVVKVIDYVLVSVNLVGALVHYCVLEVGKYFDTDYQAVSVFVDLGGLLNAQLNSLCHWASLDSNKALAVQILLDSGVNLEHVRSVLFGVQKSYHASKLAKSLRAQESSIKSAINRHIESIVYDKGYTIKSVLECSFCKVELDHLIVGNKLILESELVKTKVDLFDVVSNLPNGKAAGLSGISNELWKHCDKSVMSMFLELLNICLISDILMNTHPIALIKTAHKILTKILSDKISLACSSFDVLCGNNFSVLKDISIQSPIFAVGSVIEDALEKNRKLWLIMTNFGLTNGYHVYDGLDQGEVFLSLLWYIFYDPLLCKIKRQESVCGYRLNSHFISKNGHPELVVGLFFFFATGAFSATQHIFNVASEFFWINDISINTNKTVVIFINCKVGSPSLIISSSPIAIVKKEESHQYLGIFFSTEDFSKPSLAKAQLDVHFFSNLVLRKAISNKQFLYLVSAVFHPIVSYRTQFSFILFNVCNKWDTLIRKGLKLKLGLPLDFLNDSIHYSYFYGLKSFEQVQSEGKITSLMNFANSGGTLGCMFSHRSHDLQVLCWHSIHFLSSLVYICISLLNNFLAGVYGVPMSVVLGETKFHAHFSSLYQYDVVFIGFLWSGIFNWKTFKCWKRLDPHGLVLNWFSFSVIFFREMASFPVGPSVLGSVDALLSILESQEFRLVCDYLSHVSAGSLSVYTDNSLKDLGTIQRKTGAAIFFENIGLGLGVRVNGLLSSTLVELQAIALALECVSFLSLVCLYSDSQTALDVCKSELHLICPDFHIQCWVELEWVKVKSYSGAVGNNRVDAFAAIVSSSDWHFLFCLKKHCLLADSVFISSNFRHFLYFSLVWHLNLHIAAGFTDRPSASLHTYFMKVLYYCLSVAVQKHLYFRHYPSVLCLFYDKIETFDHVFFCGIDFSTHCQLLNAHAASWELISGLSHSFSCVSQLLLSYAFDFSASTVLFKGFVFNNWFQEAVSVFFDPKLTSQRIVDFVCTLSLSFRDGIWSVHAKHRVFIERNRLISLNSSIPVSIFSLLLGLSTGVIRLLGIADAFGLCSFFSGIGNDVSVHIVA
ncbi:hypothetical protein G9A89_021992 [Geosiphon pyriformis]|nr:hypothetical protein G9A89_021992 [Geosiphon pyriformis]